MSDDTRKERPIVTGGPGPMGGGPRGLRGVVEKPKDFRGTTRRLIQYLKPQTAKLMIVFALAIASTAFAVYGPKISGNAVNQLMNGFVAKSMVSGISKAQEQGVPQIQKALQGMQTAQDAAVTQAQAAVRKQFDATLATQKQQAYAQAEAQATKIITTNPPKELVAAEQQVQAEVTKQFDAKLAAQKQQAYAQAEAQATQTLTTNPPQELITAEQQAEAAAEAAAKLQVDQQFAAKFPGVPLETIPGYADALAAAQQQASAAAKTQVDAAALTQAIAQAKAAVDAAFVKQQPAMQAALAAAQKQALAQVQAAALTQAIAQAKAAVDAAFVKQQPAMAKALAAAQAKAVDAATSAVQKGFLDAAKLTPAQLTAMQQFVALPLVSGITDNNKKADTVLTIINLGKLLPMTGQQQTINVSQTDLDKGIADIRENGGTIPLPAIGKTLLFLLLVYVLSALLTFVMQYIMSDVAQKTTYDMRKELDYKLAALPLRYYDMHSNGEILSRMTNDMDTISTTLQQGLTQVIVSVFQILGYIYMMLTISGKLTIVTLATLPLYILTTVLIARKSQKFYRAQQVHLGRLSSHAEEMYTGHNVVKAFGHEQESIATFEAVNNDLYQAGWKAQFMSGVMFPLMNFISNIGYVFIAVLGGVYVTRNLLNLGDITAFIQYSRSFSMPIIQTASIANVIQSTMACAERVFGVLDEPEEKPDADDAIVIAEPRGAITFDHVAFSYRPTEPLIADMNLDVKQGDTVAIVGPTGAGKTTLVNLLMRFYDIQSGAITFDGVETRKMRRGSLRTMFGMVLQDTWLFNGTIRENIAYGRDDATEEEIVVAAKAAHADHFIRSLPEGYDTVLNEEASNISAGQKQLLTIARVVLANPTVLILDEATSSVDTRTEVRIQKAMAQLMTGRTSFVIAHRLSTIRDAHHILVMNHGAIVEQGTHKELLAQHGFYADLYNSQFTGAAIT
jgi:ATP-binding cassette subfamily B multidrug efflux pump